MIRDLLAEVGHTPNKYLGQNFLTDQNIVRKIVSVAKVNDSTNVVEIGAGTGALTGALADTARSVVAYEVDTSLEPILAAVLGDRANVEIRIVDAARVNLGQQLEDGQWTMAANLPYNVGTGIVLDALRTSPKIVSFVVMVQREVADRLLAPPGSKTYGLPSVIVGLHARGSIAFSVPPQVFEPQPRVESAVVVLDRIEPHPMSNRAIALAGTAFGQRRKMLRSSLASALTNPASVIAEAGIEPTMRPEDLTPEDFVAIAQAEAAS